MVTSWQKTKTMDSGWCLSYIQVFSMFGLKYGSATSNSEQRINKPPSVLHRKDRGQDCEMLCLAVRKACESMQVPLPLWVARVVHAHVAWFRGKLPSFNGIETVGGSTVATFQTGRCLKYAALVLAGLILAWYFLILPVRAGDFQPLSSCLVDSHWTGDFSQR